MLKLNAITRYCMRDLFLAASILNSAENVRRCRFVMEHLIYGGDFTT
ncbi:hypothetical protein L1D25_13450 [Vibrio parahaemolyticus]|nr:hypothetical protein [Vibrio parahaemolyticus]MCG9540208.1 hypothetical protein [Vibrio parahaemolyticus]